MYTYKIYDFGVTFSYVYFSRQLLMEEITRGNEVKCQRLKCLVDRGFFLYKRFLDYIHSRPRLQTPIHFVDLTIITQTLSSSPVLE